MASNDKDRLGKSDVILIGSVVAFGVIAYWIHQEANRCSRETASLLANVEDVRYAIQRNEEQIRAGNLSLEEGNEMLRELVKQRYGIQD